METPSLLLPTGSVLRILKVTFELHNFSEGFLHLTNTSVAVTMCLAALYVLYWVGSQFSLFVVVVFYEVTVNTESTNTESLLLEEVQGEVPASLRSQCLHHPLSTLPALCVFLFKDALFSRYC